MFFYSRNCAIQKKIVILQTIVTLMIGILKVGLYNIKKGVY